MKILITGGTGFVGSYLTAYLEERGDHLTILTRNPGKYSDTEQRAYRSLHDDLAPYAGQCDAIINLAGENLFDQRWTGEVKRRIRASRVDITKSLVDAVSRADNRPKVMVSASAVDYYGDQGNKVVDESHPPGKGFLSEVCLEWEQAAEGVKELGVRLAIPRIGIVLEQDGGALSKMLTPFKLFAGGPLGDGSQFFPWIHMEDLCRGIIYAIDSQKLSGPFNAVAPNPVTMKTFTRELGQVLGRPSMFKVPQFVLNTVLGESAVPITASKNVVPKALVKADFTFNYPFVDQALKEILVD